MALALNATSSGQDITGAVSTLTVSHTCTGNDLILMVGVATSTSGSADNITAATYNGVAMTKVGSKANSGGNKIAALFYLIGPATGAHNVVVTLSGNAVIQVDNASFTGAAGLGQAVVTANSNPSGTTACANTLITTVDNSIHVVAYAADASAITSVTNGTLVSLVLAYSNPLLITPAASHTMTGNSAGNNQWASFGAAFVPGTQGRNIFFSQL